MINIHDEVLAFIAENQDESNKENFQKSRKEIGAESKSTETKDNSINNIDEILKYAQNFFFKIVDHRAKNGALWVYHDNNKSIHSIRFQRMGMKYKKGRGWWIK